MVLSFDSSSEHGATSTTFSAPVARATWAAGLVYLLGSVVDLAILWLGQRQPGLQWEFVAITNTVEAWPRLILAVALIYVGLYLGGSESKALYRILAVCLLVFGLTALALGGLMGLNYMSVRANLPADGAALVRSAVLKTELLCGLYAVLLIPIGVLGLIGAKSKP